MYLSIIVVLSTYLSIYLCTDQSIYLSASLLNRRHRSDYLPIYPSTSPPSPIYLSTLLPIYLPTYLPTTYVSISPCPSACLFALSIYLPTYLSIYQSTICLLTVCLFIHGTSVCRPSICLCVCLSFYLLSGYRSACRSVERSTYPLSSCLHTQNPHGCRTQGRIITYAYFGGSLLFLFLRPQ